MNIKQFLGNTIGSVIAMRHKKLYLSRLNEIGRSLGVKQELTTAEKQTACRAGLGKGFIPYLNFYKSACGNFDLRYIPCWLYADMEYSLNNRRFEGFPQHKCNLRFFVPKENRPETLVYCLDGTLYDADNKVISLNECIGILQNENQFVFKIATGTGGGAGVRKIDSNTSKSVSKLTKLIKNCRNDFICQKIIRQSVFMKSLSGGSVNTIRMLTLNLNGKFSLLSSFLRIGPVGSFTDNVCGGGMRCGLNKEGNFNEFGYTHSFEKTFTSPNGKPLKGLKIENFDKIKQLVEKLSYNFQQMHLIGWDIAIREDGMPVVIEINLDSAVLPTHQLFNGPVFGNRTEEVMDYYREHRPVSLLKIPI